MFGIHRHCHTPVRLHRMKLMKANLEMLEVGTFLHCIWKCNLFKPIWKQVAGLVPQYLYRPNFIGGQIPITKCL